MKIIVVLFIASIVTFNNAKPIDDSSQAQILKYENENIGINNFKFAYETSDGVSRQEEGELKNEGSEDEALVVRGSVTWTSPEGEVFTLNFVADENGYRATGDHLPQPPVV
ncbi:hypothetical protein PVAND_006576 [Polypedilum vanderplanki]|uniref:Endocuticle structural glycoprotein n=1 Tax=Polypedilum vanderplanki TaxID=319348 RepID=A0A9J6C433_POLVA|nr:hypothetical protein PVAND_006576 [Polypedilum vanderplanki]